MNEEPEKRNILYENFILAWTRLGNIRRILKRLMDRKSYKYLPETVKDDLKEIKEIVDEKPREE
jgi:hypothetical protein